MTDNRSIVLASGYANPDQAGIQAFLFDESSGELSLKGSCTGIIAPSFLTVHPNQKWVYAVSETGLSSHNELGSVCAFQFDRETFHLQLLNRQTSRGDWPCHLQFDRTAKWLIATNYGSGNAALYPIFSDGSLGEMTDFVEHHGHGPNAARQEGPHAHSSIFTPDNHFAIIADLGIDQLVIYAFDAQQGKLHPHSIVHAQPGAGPRHLAFHSNGKWFYAANELASTVTFYIYDDAKGTLLETQSLSTIPADVPENIVADIHIAGDGKRLYVSNRGHNSIAAFEIQDNGTLSPISMFSCGGNWPRNFAISPAGQHMLIANQYSNEISVLPILDAKGAPGDAVSRFTMTGVSCIQFT